MSAPTRRLILPDGGAFDLPMPPGATDSPAVVVTSGASACPSALVVALGGLVLGGVSVWLLLKLNR
jgi:hypothetical protein